MQIARDPTTHDLTLHVFQAGNLTLFLGYFYCLLCLEVVSHLKVAKAAKVATQEHATLLKEFQAAHSLIMHLQGCQEFVHFGVPNVDDAVVCCCCEDLVIQALNCLDRRVVARFEHLDCLVGLAYVPQSH